MTDDPEDEAVLGELEGWVRQFSTFLFIPTCFGLQQSEIPASTFGFGSGDEYEEDTGHHTSFA